jgi:hypothetical protein
MELDWPNETSAPAGTPAAGARARPEVIKLARIVSAACGVV